MTIFASEGFLNSDRKIVSRILKLDSLTCTKTETFEALLSWIKVATGKIRLTKEIVRDQFDDLFHEIRFGLMTSYEFLQIAIPYSRWFTPEEYRTILNEIKNTKNNTTEKI